jgi:hypothetical protein
VKIDRYYRFAAVLWKNLIDGGILIRIHVEKVISFYNAYNTFELLPRIIDDHLPMSLHAAKSRLTCSLVVVGGCGEENCGSASISRACLRKLPITRRSSDLHTHVTSFLG